MKVTVDTRHDSLDEALATVRAAFGASGDFVTDDGDGPNKTPDVAGVDVSITGASPAGPASATPAATRTPAPRSTRAGRPSGRNRGEPAGSMKATSTIAPQGIRSWAKSQGMEVKRAGRLPAAVIQAYRESFEG